MKKIPLILIPILIIAAVFIKTTRTQTTHPDGAYLFTGTAETTSIRLSFKTSGRINGIIYDEGDEIMKDALVATLDDADEKLGVSAAEAGLSYAQATLSEVLAGSRKQEIRNAKAALDMADAGVKKAEASLSQAKSDNERFKALYESNGVSKRTYELYETAYETAQQAYKEATAAKAKAAETLSLAVEGARSEEIEKAKANVSIYEQTLEQAKQKLVYTKLHSPINGVVLTRSAENGEFIQTGNTVLTVADLTDMWIRGYVSEDYLGKVKLGQKVIIKSDSYPDKEYIGKVSYISSEAEFTPKTVQTYDERINFMYMIKVTVDNTSKELKYGMPVEGRIVLEN